MMVLLLLTTRLVVALPGAGAADAEEHVLERGRVRRRGGPAPAGPTCNRAGELTVPASKSRPASFTPSTSATSSATTPLSGMSVGVAQTEDDRVRPGHVERLVQW